MKKILLKTILILVFASAGYLFWREMEKPFSKTAQVPVITLNDGDLAALGTKPEAWTSDLETLQALFESFGAGPTEMTPTEQVASIPPELYALGPSLELMRAQATEDTTKAKALAELLEHQARRAELFLPIRALALTHLVLLGRSTEIQVDYESFDQDVRSLADVVLVTP